MMEYWELCFDEWKKFCQILSKYNYVSNYWLMSLALEFYVYPKSSQETDEVWGFSSVDYSAPCCLNLSSCVVWLMVGVSVGSSMGIRALNGVLFCFFLYRYPHFVFMFVPFFASLLSLACCSHVYTSHLLGIVVGLSRSRHRPHANMSLPSIVSVHYELPEVKFRVNIVCRIIRSHCRISVVFFLNTRRLQV